MASAQVPSLIRMYRAQPNGNKTLIFQSRIESLAPAGGASEGAGTAVSTPEKLLTVNSNVVLVNDDILLVSAEADSAVTLGTITKSIWNIPLITNQGSKAIGRAQFANPTPAAIALVASTETFIGGYKVVEGAVRLSGKIYLDLQNNS